MAHKGDRNGQSYESRPDYQRAAETVRGQLMERGISLRGDEEGEDLIDLLEAVQRFERAVADVGGDSMTNAPDSRHPDHPDYVLPMRRDDERAAAHVRRIEGATRRLRGI
jgi:hypothetical protein